MNGGSLLGAWRDPETGSCRFTAPQGIVELNVWDAVYVSDPVAVEVGEGGYEGTVRARRTPGFLLTLKDGEETLRPSPTAVRVVELDGRGGQGRPHRHGDGLRYRVPRPGLYRVEVDSPPGYLPVPAQVVRVEAGRDEELVVSLAQ